MKHHGVSVLVVRRILGGVVFAHGLFVMIDAVIPKSMVISGWKIVTELFFGIVIVIIGLRIYGRKTVCGERENKHRNDRAIRWLIDGLLLIFFFPMVIPASDSRGLIPDRFFRILPIFFGLLLLRIVCRKRD